MTSPRYCPYSRSLLSIALFAVTAAAHTAELPSFALPGEEPGWPLAQHLDQRTLPSVPVEQIHEWGRQLFYAEFNRLDGVGANLSAAPGSPVRFMRPPNVNQPGVLSPLVKRPGGPEAQSCGGCHVGRRTTGSGAVYSVARDQLR